MRFFRSVNKRTLKATMVGVFGITVFDGLYALLRFSFVDSSYGEDLNIAGVGLCIGIFSGLFYWSRQMDFNKKNAGKKVTEKTGLLSVGKMRSGEYQTFENSKLSGAENLRYIVPVKSYGEYLSLRR